MFKRILSVLMIVALMMTVMAGCSSKEKPVEPVAGNQEEALKVGFVFVGPIGDGGWSFAHNEGRLYLEENGIETIFKEAVPEGQEVEKVMRDMIDQGAKVIFATSFGYMDYVEKLSKEFTDVKFLHCSGYKTTENMTAYFGRMYEPRYLSGIVAGLKTKSNKIGYVAAYEISEVVRGINAFTLGVREANPEATVSVRWTHTWYDPAKEKEAAKSLLDEGADVIAQHQDTAGPQQAAEEAGAFAVGYNTDSYDKAPKAYMTAPVWNWGPYYLEQVKAIQDDTWKSGNYWGNTKDGIVALGKLSDNAPKEAEDAVKSAMDKLLNDGLKVFAGPIKDQDGNIKVKAGEELSDAEMLSMKWFVEGVVGKIEE